MSKGPLYTPLCFKLLTTWPIIVNSCTECEDLLRHLVAHTERHDTTKHVIDTPQCHDIILQHMKLVRYLSFPRVAKSRKKDSLSLHPVESSGEPSLLVILRTQAPVIHEVWAAFDRFDEHERITLHFLKQGLVGLRPFACL